MVPTASKSPTTSPASPPSATPRPPRPLPGPPRRPPGPPPSPPSAPARLAQGAPPPGFPPGQPGWARGARGPLHATQQRRRVRGPVLGGGCQTVPYDLPPVLGESGGEPQLLRATGVARRRVAARLRGVARQRERTREDDVGQHAEGPDVGGGADQGAPRVGLRPEKFGRGVVRGG